MVVTLDNVLQINKEYRFTFSIKKKISLIQCYTQSQKIGIPNNLKKGNNIILWGMNRICLVYASGILTSGDHVREYLVLSF